MTDIRLIPRDPAGPRQGRSKAEPSTAPSPESLNPLLRSVAGASIEEIDRIFLELQRIRDELHGEGARLGREFARFASLNQSILASMKIIRESLKPIGSDDGNGRP